MKYILVFAALIVALTGCSDETPKPVKSTPEAYPQSPHVKVGDLAKVLPKDRNGNAVLWKFGDTKLVLGPRATPGPTTSYGACLDLQNSCLIAADRSKKMRLEECIRRSPRCVTDEPWTEDAACCPTACVEAYDEERRLGASQLKASSAVFGSAHECFPGLREWYRSKGDPNPRLMPRLAPLPKDAK